MYRAPSRVFEIRLSLLSSLEGLKLLEKVLVQNQHYAALHTGPDGAWPNATEPANKAFRLVDHAEAGNHG